MDLQFQALYGSARKAVSREQMVPLLYRGTRQWIAEGLAAFAAGRWDEAADRVGRAQTVLYELSAALDETAGGELAKNLRSLYGYWIRQLSAGLAARDPAPLEEVAGYLDELGVCWDEAARKVRVQRARP